MNTDERSVTSFPMMMRYRLGALLFASMALVNTLSNANYSPLWVNAGLLTPACWCGFRWFQGATRSRVRQLISSRLARLPSDFVVLHDLTVPAPWGHSHVDHLILSRFGLVVVADGPSPNWMLEQVEAVRSLLFAQGLMNPVVPIRSLVLLPPGAPDAHIVESDAPVIRVEQVRLNHLAPSKQPVLHSGQIKSILRELVPTQQTA